MSEQLTILQGDWIEQLRQLPDECVQCCVTSPPYWGLRDYGVPGQLGLEKTPEEYVAKMVEGFEEVWRVLRKDGTCWVNLGDTYNSNPCSNGVSFRRDRASVLPDKSKRIARGSGRWGQSEASAPGLKTKDLVGIPWRVAFALQAAGWYLRSDIIWSKPNPMPESVSDRPTKAHEYIFLLTKSERYFYDAEAILEPCSPNTHARISQNVAAQVGSERANGGAKTNGNMKAVVRVNPKAQENAPGSRQNESFARGTCLPVLQRNKRSVWEVPTYSFKGAHFATFPPDLIKPCILAGTRPGDMVLDPFGGSGTTGQVALELGRRATLIELNPEYVKLAERRCDVTPGLQLA